MKILFCTDGSRISYEAVKNLSGWIKNATIDVICVIDWSFLPDKINIEEQNFTVSCANVADTILDYSENLIKQCGFQNGERIKNCGSAIDSILEQTQLKNYDLILMGSHGKKGIQKWLGSVSQEIINHSNLSNYITKLENTKQRLLLTTDGSECSDTIIENILPELKLDNKEIYICMVNEDPKLLFLDGNIDTNWLMDIQRKQQIYAANAIQRIQTLLNKENIDADETAILTGNPSQKIIEYSKEKDIDLTILGSRNKSRIDRFLTGSESKRILENTLSDVWLARCK